MPPDDGFTLVDIDQVEAARRVLAGVIRPTPIDPAPNLSRLCGREVLLKPEHRQRTGSFKVRGAYNFISALPPDHSLVVAASAGNHAQGVALAASLTGRRSIIFMPESAPLPKVQATRDYGAEVRFGPPIVDDCITEAKAFAGASGATFVPPFDDPRIIAGQGTLGLELVDEETSAQTVLVPVGGGGLLAGVAVALRARRPDIRIVGVEADGAASMRSSLAAGRPTPFEPVHTIADGIAIKTPSALTLAHVISLVDDVITVTDDEIARALLMLVERCKQVVEPAGAVGLAALLAGKVPGHDPALAVLSGGNVDPLVLSRLLEHGLSAAGRYLRLRVIVPDRPGGLADVTAAVAAQGLNVLSVEHHREGVHLGLDEVEVLLTVETRDPAHREGAIDSMRRAGHHVELL